MYSTANVLYLTFYFMETFLVLEIDNVIDIEDDLFWQCINAPHVRNDNTKKKIIMAFNTLRHERLNSKSSFKSFSWVFRTNAQALPSTWTERVVHCAFDDKEKNTKALAANDRSLAAPTIMQNYMRRRWWSLFDATWPARHITVWDAISRTMSAK